MATDVRALHTRELLAAGRLLGRAFASDPVIGTFLTGRRRRLALPSFFRAALEDAVASDSAYVVDDDGPLVGVAAWLPPEPRAPAGVARVRAAVSMTAVQALFPRSLGPLLNGFEALAEMHPEETHWYLAFIGVEPRVQGRGVGHRLMTSVHARADAGGHSCYLETPFPATHTFYERLGYRSLGETAPFEGAPPVTRFLRPPSRPL